MSTQLITINDRPISVGYQIEDSVTELDKIDQSLT
jgi:hypothetical protein